MAIPGVGPITATVGDAEVFASGRHLAARLGLVPRQRSSGGKERLGGIPKAGDGHPRPLLVQGAQALLRWREGAQALLRWRGRATPRVEGLLRRRPVNVAAVAIADKTARITRAVMAKGEAYRRPEAAVVAGWVPGCEDL
ncbi:MAG TPA: transposase, partial [Candidatus Dormibacteraeota bacterium]